MAFLDLGKVKVAGRETIAEKAAKVRKPVVDKPDRAFCQSAIESGWSDLPCTMQLPNGDVIDFTMKAHGFSSGTLGWQARPNEVAKVTTHGGATRTLRINGDFKMYLGGTKEIVAEIAAAAHVEDGHQREVDKQAEDGDVVE